MRTIFCQKLPRPLAVAKRATIHALEELARTRISLIVSAQQAGKCCAAALAQQEA
jgi:hypothetical protein